jgi:hypothetical protein
MQRSKQKRTMADIRAIAGAWEAREVDAGRYNAAGWSLLPSTVVLSDLESAITPTYIREIPRRDGWGSPWTITVSSPWGGTIKAHAYQIVSGGRDGQVAVTAEVGGTTNFDCDIVYQNGAFYLYPVGVQAGN